MSKINEKDEFRGNSDINDKGGEKYVRLGCDEVDIDKFPERHGRET